MAAQYLHHPYRLPVIGWFHEIAGYTREDALEFYRQWYAPNNAVLVVAGDVTAAELRPLAERTYGSVAARHVPPRRRLAEPPQHAERRVDAAPRAGAPAEPDALLSGAQLRLGRATSTPMRWSCWPRSWAAAAPAGCSARSWSSGRLAAGAGCLLPRHRPGSAPPSASMPARAPASTWPTLEGAIDGRDRAGPGRRRHRAASSPAPVSG